MSRQNLHGDAAAALNSLRALEVRGPNEAALVRKNLGMLRGIGLNDQMIADRLGDRVDELGLVVNEGGRLVLRTQARAAHMPEVLSFDALSVAGRMGELVVAQQMAVQLDARYMAFNSSHVPRKQAALKKNWDNADLAGRARLMVAAPAITSAGLASAVHNGSFENMETYKRDERIEKLSSTLQAARGQWRLDDPEALPAPDYTLVTHEDNQEPVQMLQVTQTRLQAVSPVMFEVRGRTVDACRAARVVCRQTIALDAEVAEVLGPEDGPLADPTFAQELLQSHDTSLAAPVSTVLVASQEMAIS